ncbi:MAG: CDP-alcohol phosphatidyltransferase family protein [Thermoplasmata archaeon]|nr:CDP-alcohol phosphatidyltransferase family protein [Thermoplasmata archaeon]
MLVRDEIPNVATAANGVVGILAVMYSIDHAFVTASLLILLAIVLDGIDGALARMMSVESAVGRDMDSVADMLSFCIAPAVLIYSWHYDTSAGASLGVFQDQSPERAVNLMAVVASGSGMLLGMYRLNRYRIADYDLGHFRGLPTPAYAFFVVVAMYTMPGVEAMAAAMVVGLLMVAPIRYPKLRGWLAVPALVGLALAAAALASPDLRVVLMVPALTLIAIYIAGPAPISRFEDGTWS